MVGMVGTSGVGRACHRRKSCLRTAPRPACYLRDAQAQGCHRLHRDGAKLVETVDDILEELGPLAREAKADDGEAPARPPAELILSDIERSLLGTLDDQPMPVGHIIARTGLTVSRVMATLSILEMRRLVLRAPGNQSLRA
jgi:DNA processing protein